MKFPIPQKLYGEEAIAHANGLVLPWRQGSSLARVLSSKDIEREEKLAAVDMAAVALRKLHRTRLVWPDGETRPLSHRDATAANCIVGAEGASWLDFETRHDTERAAEWRKADDLRCLVYSSAYHAAASDMEGITRSILHSYSDEAVLTELRRLVIGWSENVDLYRLAQAPLGFHRRSRLERVVLSLLER